MHDNKVAWSDMEGRPNVAAFLPQSETFLHQKSEFYRPLNFDRAHIRLMHIEPAPFEERTIRITVSEADLDDEPSFEAISYTWADLERTEEVLLHDIPYNVTSNQYAALRRLRNLDRVRTMWMDVICIDQANVEERAYQVSIMGKIYASSLHTAIWLSEIEDEWLQGISDYEWDNGVFGRRFHTQCPRGQDVQVFAAARALGGAKGPKSTDLMTLFRQQRGHPDRVVRGTLLMLELLAQQDHLCELPSYAVSDSGEVTFYRPWFESAKLLLRLLCHPWWTRVWVLQEVLLCKGQPTVVFGDNEIPYAAFTSAADAFCRHIDNCRCCSTSTMDILLEEWIQPMTIALARISNLSQHSRIMSPGQMTLKSAATLTKHRHATDTRDFVYGILGLVRKTQHVKVNYKIPAAKLFTQASFDVLKISNELDLLSEGSIRTESRLTDLPTWSMDWENFRQLHFNHDWTFARDEQELADWSKIQFDSTTGSLQVEANALDSVRILFKTERGPSGSEPLTRAATVKYLFSSWIDQLRSSGVIIDINHHTLRRETMSELAKELFVTAYRDTRVIKGKDASYNTCVRFGDEEWDALVQWWIGLNKIADSLTRNSEDFEMQGRYPNEFPYFLTENLKYSLEDSQLALTEGGRLCIVPSAAKPGDELYHVRTCKAPIILRAVPSSGTSQFQVVGSGFLHGAMGSAGWKPIAERVICLV